MKVGATTRTFSLCALLWAATSSYAEPFSLLAPASAELGAKGITITLFDDSITGLEAADLLLTFDAAVFKFVETKSGTATGGFSVLGNEEKPPGGQVRISLSTSGNGVDNESGSLAAVVFDVFDIDTNARPQPYEFVFESVTTDYVVPATRGGVQVTRPAMKVVEPLSVTLVGIGLFSLAAVCRRRTRLSTGQQKDA